MSGISRIFRLMQLSDSALPVGGFSFSVGLEAAVAAGRVTSERSLGEFLLAAVRQSATCDGVASLAACRAMFRGDFATAQRADELLSLFKVGDESRRMSLRMGHKLAELACDMFPMKAPDRWAEAIRESKIEGHHATTLGVLFATLGLSEEELFTTLLFGVAAQITSAALRLMRIDHRATQRLLFALAPKVEELYAELSPRTLDEIELFAPELEILCSMHEQGNQRMFMS